MFLNIKENLIKLHLAWVRLVMDICGHIVCEYNDKETRLQGKLVDIYSEREAMEKED